MQFNLGGLIRSTQTTCYASLCLARWLDPACWAIPYGKETNAPRGARSLGEHSGPNRRAEPQQHSFPVVEIGFSCSCSGRGLSPQGPRSAEGRKWYTTKRALTLVNAMQCTVLPHITASVFINDDESGLHHDYEMWLERLAPHAPISQCRPRGRLHNRTGEDACPGRTGPPMPT